MGWWNAVVRAAMVLGLCLGASCGGGGGGGGGSDDEDDDEDRTKPDRGDIVVSFEQPPDAETELLIGAMREGFEEIAMDLNDGFAFPRDLPVSHARCGETNAFYDPQTRSMTMCYELLSMISQMARNAMSSEEEYGERVVGTWFFVFFHELGHGLVDMFDLAITGREEDSVDNLATMLLVEGGEAFAALRAAEFWASLPVGELDFADEHSLNQQRFYNILCLVYGSDPEQYAGLVTAGHLPESRAVGCPSEYAGQRRAWGTLLAPWIK